MIPDTYFNSSTHWMPSAPTNPTWLCLNLSLSIPPLHLDSSHSSHLFFPLYCPARCNDPPVCPYPRILLQALLLNLLHPTLKVAATRRAERSTLTQANTTIAPVQEPRCIRTATDLRLLHFFFIMYKLPSCRKGGISIWIRNVLE